VFQRGRLDQHLAHPHSGVPARPSRRAAGGALARLIAVFLLAGVFAGCASPPRSPAPIDPDVARAGIEKRLPAQVVNRSGWAADISTAVEALNLPPSAQNVCAVLAVAEQESNLQVDPQVPGLPKIARREIETRAADHHIPLIVVQTALEIRSPT